MVRIFAANLTQNLRKKNLVKKFASLSEMEEEITKAKAAYKNSNGKITEKVRK